MGLLCNTMSINGGSSALDVSDNNGEPEEWLNKWDEISLELASSKKEGVMELAMSLILD